MNIKLGLGISGAVLGADLITPADMQEIGSDLADGQRERISRGEGADGQALTRNDMGAFLRRTGRMLNTLGPTSASSRRVIVRSRARYAGLVDAKTPFLGVDDPEEIAETVAAKMTGNMNAAKSRKVMV